MLTVALQIGPWLIWKTKQTQRDKFPFIPEMPNILAKKQRSHLIPLQDCLGARVNTFPGWRSYLTFSPQTLGKK